MIWHLTIKLLYICIMIHFTKKNFNISLNNMALNQQIFQN